MSPPWKVAKMKEILLKTEWAAESDGSVLGVTCRPVDFLGSTFNHYISAMRASPLYFDSNTKSYLSGDLAADAANSMVDEISESLWAAGFAVVSGIAKAEATAKVDVGGIISLFETASENLKFPKIRMEANGSKLVLSRAGARSKYVGEIMLTDGGSYGSNVWYGRIDINGDIFPSRSMTPDVMKMVETLANDPVGVAKTYGSTIGDCCFCGRRLTDDRSVGTGYGPVCAKNFGLPWGGGAA